MRKWLILAYLFIAAQGFAQLVWERVELPGKQSAVFTSPRNIVFVRGDYGTNIIYRSYDEGLTWDSVITPGKKGTGYYGRSIVAVDSFGFIYSQYSDSLWVSTNDGITWDLRKQPSAFGLFFLASRDSVFLFSYGPWVFASSDQGASWSGIRTHSNGGDIGWAGAQISPGGNVFGFLQFDGSVWLMGGSHAQRSIQTKFSQFAIDNDPISWMMFDQEGFGYGEHNGMLIRSSDDGLTWVAIDSMNSEYRKRYWGPYGALKGGGIISVSDTETVVSYDQTDTWSGIGEGVPTNYGHTFVTSHRGTIFIETNSGVFRTSHFAAVKSRKPNATSIGFDPVSKILILNDIESNSRFIVTDIIGRIAEQKMLRDPKEYRIDLSGLGSGTYVAAVISRSGTKSTMLSIFR